MLLGETVTFIKISLFCENIFLIVVVISQETVKSRSNKTVVMCHNESCFNLSFEKV